MYKMHLEQAQREISCAQELLDGLEARRHSTEQDAARQEDSEQSISAAREEGKRQGWHEGFHQGILRGRREAESELRSRRREEEDDQRAQSRPHPLGDARFTQVSPISSTAEHSSADDLNPRGVSECVNPTPYILLYFIHIPERLHKSTHSRNWADRTIAF
jgi:hypothetical protein